MIGAILEHVSERVVEVAAFTAGLLAEDVERLATRDLGPLVTVLSSLRSAAEALLSAVTAAALERGEPETCCDGGVSARQWVSDWQGEGPRQAGRLLATTTALGRLPQVRAAYRRGLISSAHAQAACRAARQLPAGALGAGDRVLATTAPHVLPEDVSALVHRLVHTVDPDGAARRAEQLTDGQHLSLDQFGDGSYAVHGLLGPAEGALVVAALAPLMVSIGEGDTRTRRRRCADALVEACRRTAAHPDGPGVHGVRPTVLLLVDETGHRPAETSDGTVLDRGAALALACDASTHRLSHAACPATARRGGVLPLQLGRATRLATKPQLLALIARDRGCVHPRCTRPPSWTQAHHLIAWSADGHTDVTMMALLCSQHHTHLHRTQQHLHPPTRPDAPWTITGTPPTRTELRRALGQPARGGESIQPPLQS